MQRVKITGYRNNLQSLDLFFKNHHSDTLVLRVLMVKNYSHCTSEKTETPYDLRFTTPTAGLPRYSRSEDCCCLDNRANSETLYPIPNRNYSRKGAMLS